MRGLYTCAALLLLGLTPSVAQAKDRGDVRWLRRWAPERNMGEVGAFGGILVPARRLELFEATTELPLQGYKPFNRVAPDFGLRAGYYPLRFLGVELEGAVMPTQTFDRQSALLWSFRGHVVGQLGLWSVTPFILAGIPAFGVTSDRTAVGNDVDLGFHFGGGVKFYVHRYVGLRVDLRDNLSARRGVDAGVVHSFEALFGLSITLGRKKQEPQQPGDRDGDGVLDPDDKCIDTPGVPEYQGCPIPDTDGDGILDPQDDCPETPGVPEYKGCPIPDTDEDGIVDPEDECPEEPGVPEYKGCPIPDTDGDGILDPEDQCIEEPETFNEFEDEDGCPDAAPATESFTGVIEGISFDVNKAKIRRASAPKLEEAIETLKKYPKLRIEISGHTDSRGNEKHNMDLSQRRAEAVKTFMVERGIEENRIETRGAGENEPIESNRSSEGRAKNRRIEFRLLD